MEILLQSGPSYPITFQGTTRQQSWNQSLRDWVIGGYDYEESRFLDDLKISFNQVPLKDLAMDYVALNISPNDVRMQPDRLPKDLKEEIEDYRSNLGKFYICSEEEGYETCLQAKNQ